jgi:hypothetical protein
VAFEPRLTAAGTGWQGLEYVPHPDPDRQQMVATPDVAVYASDPPQLLVIDAKYVARGMLQLDAARLHEKYARFRASGHPVATTVVAAHPHPDIETWWAGYGMIPFVPGRPLTALPLPALATPSLDGGSRAAPQASRPVALIADQGWMRDRLAGRRIDLGDLRARVGGTHEHPPTIVLPDLVQLQGFMRAAEGAGWAVQPVTSPDRSATAARIVDLANEAQASGAVVVVVSKDPTVLDALWTAGVAFRVFADLDAVAGLRWGSTAGGR